MRLTSVEDEDAGESGPTNLLCGIGSKHIRMICENGWEGGYGYTPQQVGDLSLDQIFMLLCDKHILRDGKKERIAHVGSVSSDKDGYVKGRDAQGKPMKAKILGESKAARLLRESQEKQKNNKRRKRRGKRRGN